MSKQKQNSGSHFTLDDRILIEDGLNNKLSIRNIAKSISKSPSSVLREISRNITIKKSNKPKCKNFDKCRIAHVCSKSGCYSACKDCRKFDCTSVCASFKPFEDKCPKGLSVCNSCYLKSGVGKCEFTKRVYSAREADNKSRNRSTDARNGFNLTGEQFSKIDEIVSPLLRKGQSPYTVTYNHPELKISAQTLYRLIECGELSVCNLNLRSKVKRKPSKGCKPRKMNHEIVSKIKNGRKYEDFLKFREAYDGPVVQMDTVIGKRGEGACLLTLHMPELHFQIALILDEHTSEAVVHALDILEITLGYELFNKAFPVILTDNGSEFMDISGMERSVTDPSVKRTRIFFCEPNRSDQKGACENNHKYIRYIIPKGNSLEPYDQSDINLMMCHINSFARKSVYGKTPFALAKAALPEDFFILMGYSEVSADEVDLTPNLLKSRISQR